MEFRRSGQSNQRRRRVLKEDAAAASDEGGEGQTKRRGRGGGANARPYSEAALLEYQPRVTDLIPKRPWTLLVLILSALLAVSCVQALYAHMHIPARWVASDALRALDPTQTGSLAGWLSSSLLGLASVACVAIYSIRRHRLDDYRGRYRLWISCAVLCLLASIDATTALHRLPQGLFNLALERLGGESWSEAADFWWSVLVLTIASLVGIRLVIECRRSYGAVLWLLAAFASYAVVGAIALECLTLDLDHVAVLVESSARLAGDLAILGALFTYARYVYLDAQGILAQRRAAREAARRKRRAEKEARAAAKAQAKADRLAEKEAARAARKAGKTARSEDEAEDESSDDADESKADSSDDEDESPKERVATSPAASPRVESKPTSSPTQQPKPAVPTKPSPPVSSDNDDGDDEGDGDGDTNGMSRAERRRLKKLARRDGRRAA